MQFWFSSGYLFLCGCNSGAAYLRPLQAIVRILFLRSVLQGSKKK